MKVDCILLYKISYFYIIPVLYIILYYIYKIHTYGKKKGSGKTIIIIMNGFFRLNNEWLFLA